MREVIYIDETAFIALCDKDDQNHEKAVEFAKSLLNQTVKLTTSYLVIVNTLQELEKWKGYKKAKELFNYFDKKGIENLPENQEIRDKAKDLYLKKGTKIDAVTSYHISIMQYYAVHRAFSFNREIEIFGFTRKNK